MGDQPLTIARLSGGAVEIATAITDNPVLLVLVVFCFLGALLAGDFLCLFERFLLVSQGLQGLPM